MVGLFQISNTLKKRFKQTFQAVLKSQFSPSSSPFCPHFGIQFLLPRISSLYVEFIQSRDSELIALLFQIHSSPESSGSPLESFSLCLMFKKKEKNICVFSCFRGNLIFCESSAVFSLHALFFLSPVLCFFLSLCLSHRSESLRHSCVSTLSGGEQGRDPIPGTQLDWVVWEVWVVLLSPLPLTVFFLLFLSVFFFFYQPLSCHYGLFGNEKITSFLLTHLFSSSCFIISPSHKARQNGMHA